ncbi:MAG TPA: hypothetical protein DIS78_07610 [Lachnospiraceae bacterium]|nr:hypothetical protein [Lachnospiraceae bacterium]
MNAIVALFPAIFNVLIVAIIILSIRKRLTDKGGRRTAIRKDDPYVNNFSEMVSHYNKVNNRSSGLKMENSLTLKDDRSSDWMAKQLREEAVAMARVSDMFQLKQDHKNNCEAEFIRRFHESACDADGIDNGLPQKRRAK